MIDKESYYTMLNANKKKIKPLMFDYDEIVWIYGKWLEGYSTYELAEALNCSASTIKKVIKPFKNKKPLIVPNWIISRQRELSNEN